MRLLNALLLVLLLCSCSTPQAPITPVTVELGETAAISHIELTPDERFLIVGTASSLNVFDIWTGKKLWTETPKRSFQLSPDGRLLLVSRPRYQRGKMPRYQLLNVQTGRVVAELGGTPSERWEVEGLAFGLRGRKLALQSSNADVAVYELDPLNQMPAADQPTLTLEPIVVRQGRWEDTHGQVRQTPSLGFANEDTEIYLFLPALRQMERWSTVRPGTRLAKSRYDEVHHVFPHDASAEGRWVWRCERNTMSIADTRNPSLSPSRTFKVEVSQDGARGFVPGYAECGLSPDGRWAALSLNSRGADIHYDYNLSLWTADGQQKLQDMGYAHDPTREREVLTDQLTALRFSADSQMLYTTDAGGRLHVYALQEPVQVASIDLGPGIASRPFSTLLAVAKSSVAVSSTNHHRVIWLPIPRPGAVDAP